MEIDALIATIRNLPGCRVYPPKGLPVIREDLILPDDLRTFYGLCGGLSLFENNMYPISIVSPEDFVLANPVIVGELCEYDISSTWYIIATDYDEEKLTIDLSPARLGRCYDSFIDRHGIAGSCPIIATSFTDLLARLLDNKGQHWYWLHSDFESLGDAYD